MSAEGPAGPGAAPSRGPLRLLAGLLDGRGDVLRQGQPLEPARAHRQASARVRHRHLRERARRRALLRARGPSGAAGPSRGQEPAAPVLPGVLLLFPLLPGQRRLRPGQRPDLRLPALAPDLRPALPRRQHGHDELVDRPVPFRALHDRDPARTRAVGPGRAHLRPALPPAPFALRPRASGHSPRDRAHASSRSRPTPPAGPGATATIGASPRTRTGCSCPATRRRCSPPTTRAASSWPSLPST